VAYFPQQEAPQQAPPGLQQLALTRGAAPLRAARNKTISILFII
jgi:hypothetical protein